MPFSLHVMQFPQLAPPHFFLGVGQNITSSRMPSLTITANVSSSFDRQQLPNSLIPNQKDPRFNENTRVIDTQS